MREPTKTVQTAVCSGCGAFKLKANRWWTIKIDDGTLVLRPFHHPPREDEYNLCGMDCVTKIVDEYLHEVVGARPIPAGVDEK